MSSYAIGLGFSMLWPVPQESQGFVHELDIPLGSSFKRNTDTRPFIQ